MDEAESAAAFCVPARERTNRPVTPPPSMKGISRLAVSACPAACIFMTLFLKENRISLPPST